MDYPPIVTVVEVAAQLRSFANNIDQLIESGRANIDELRVVGLRLRACASSLDGAESPDRHEPDHATRR